MKKILSFICIATLLLSSVAYAADPVELYQQMVRFTTRLEAGDDVEETLGEAVIFMIENNILNKLNEAGETDFANDLKAKADAALDASANSSEGAADLAAQYCTKLEEAMKMLKMLPLIDNGAFDAVIEVTADNQNDYKYVSTVSSGGVDITLSEGTRLPMGWEIGCATGSLNNEAKNISVDESHNRLGEDNLVNFAGTAFSISQVVEGLTPGQNYNLSFLMYGGTGIPTNGGTSLIATVEYLFEEEYNSTTGLNANLGGGEKSGGGSGISANMQKYSQTFYAKTANNSQHSNMNFTLPDGAYGVKVKFEGMGGSTPSVYLDDVVLCESNELVTNGTFESYYYYRTESYYVTQDIFPGWSHARGVYPKEEVTTTDEAAMTILNTIPSNTENNYAGFYNAPAKDTQTVSKESSREQGILVKPEQWYKLSFKFAHEGFAADAAISPDVSLTYTGKNGENKTVIAPAFIAAAATANNAAAPNWTSYEAYILTPKPVVEGGEYTFGLVNAALTTSVGTAAEREEWKDPSSMVYYDDISLVEAEELGTAQDSIAFSTGDALYIPVNGCEHYALTVDNSTVSANTLITATVNFWDKNDAGNYEPVKVTSRQENTTKSAEYTSLNGYMMNECNVFNFTTPKACDYITVTATDASSAVLSLPVSVAVTNEVINNGELFNVRAHQSSVNTNTRFPGWYAQNSSAGTYTDGKSNYLIMTNSSTRVNQCVTLKEGSTYRFRFKFAQTEPADAEQDETSPRLYFREDWSFGTFEGLPLDYSGRQCWTDAPSLTAAPAQSSDWTEYEVYFVAKSGNTDTATYPGTEGLLQTVLQPRGYETTGGVDYFDDFSLEEVDDGSYIGYLTGADMSASGKSRATKIRYHYVKAAGDTARKFIYAEYDADDNLSYVMSIEVSESGDYDIAINDVASSSKVFLLESDTLKPLMPAMAD